MTNTREESYLVDLYAQDDWTVDEATQCIQVVAAVGTTAWRSLVKASLDYG